jgi:hypothetical protein
LSLLCHKELEVDKTIEEIKLRMGPMGNISFSGFQLENLKKRGHLEDLRLDGGYTGLNSFWFGTGTSGGIL